MVKKAQQNIALVLLGLVAIIALIGLVMLMKKTPSGAYYNPYYDKPYILESGPLSWENVFGFAPNLEAAESWCPYHTIEEGGFLDVLQLWGKGNYRCFAVPPESVPESYWNYYFHRPIACFREGTLIVSPEIQEKLPLTCNPPAGAYNPFPNQGIAPPYQGPSWS